MPDDPSDADHPVVARSGAGRVTLGRGVHLPVEAAGDLGCRLAAWQHVLPDSACFTGVTAAAARGWWLPPMPDGGPVFAATAWGGRTCERPEVRLSRHRVAPDPVVLDGLRLAQDHEIVLACARDLCLLDLVVLIDGVLQADPGSRPALERAAAQRRRGAPRLRAALCMVDPRSESPWESMLRILLRVCGVEVEPQHELFAPDGSFVARGDLWLVGTTTLAEYDGDVHLPRGQQVKDLRRMRRVTKQDWQRLGYTSGDVLHRAVSVLSDADAATGRDHEPSRIRAWHDLLRASARTPAGRAQLAQRWSLTPAEETVA